MKFIKYILKTKILVHSTLYFFYLKLKGEH